MSLFHFPMIRRLNHQKRGTLATQPAASWDIDTLPSLIINMSDYLLHQAANTGMLAPVDLDNIITHSYLDCDCIIPLHLSYNLPTAFCGVESILLLTWAISVDIASVFSPSAVKDTGF